MKPFYKILFIAVLTACPFFAQSETEKYRIDFNEIHGELTKKDLHKKDFGRYDGYQLELYKGEVLHLIVFSQNFQPALALADENGNIVAQSEKRGKDYAEIITTAQSDGNLVLYVIGESNSAGKYILRTSIADPNSLSIGDDSAFCEKLKFLLAHSMAYFTFLDNPAISKHPLVRLTGAGDVYIDDSDGSYKALFYNNDSMPDAENTYKSLSETLRNCLGRQWKMRSVEWRKNENGRDKSFLFEEEQHSNNRLIKIVLSEITDSGKTGVRNYTVQIEINRG